MIEPSRVKKDPVHFWPKSTTIFFFPPQIVYQFKVDSQWFTMTRYWFDINAWREIYLDLEILSFLFRNFVEWKMIEWRFMSFKHRNLRSIIFSFRFLFDNENVSIEWKSTWNDNNFRSISRMKRVNSRPGRFYFFPLFRYEKKKKKTNGIIFQSNVSNDLKCLEHYRIELFRVTGFSSFSFFFFLAH